jgi:hypothetical protein
MTFREAYNTGKVFAIVYNTYSYIYYRSCTVAEHGRGGQTIHPAVDLNTYNQSELDTEDPNLEILEHSVLSYVKSPTMSPSIDSVGDCTCDFYSVILRSGCKCGGK